MLDTSRDALREAQDVIEDLAIFLEKVSQAEPSHDRRVIHDIALRVAETGRGIREHNLLPLMRAE